MANTQTRLLGTEAFFRRGAQIPPPMPVVFGLVDLDGFAEINDQLGRDAGDEVLRAVERTLTTSFPDAAFATRLGGDEFGVCVPGVTTENGLILFDEVRSHLATTRHDGLADGISLSIGVASRPPHGPAFDDLHRAAQAALHRAKQEGRGRVALHIEAEKMVLKTNYYPPSMLDRLSRVSAATGRTEASLLREALETLLSRYAAQT